jgi:hypothetical protein
MHWLHQRNGCYAFQRCFRRRLVSFSRVLTVFRSPSLTFVYCRFHSSALCLF